MQPSETVQEPLPTLPAAATTVDLDKQDVEQNKDIAAFSYLWVASVIVYVLRRHSAFVRFHAKQAMVLFAMSIILWFVPVINRLLELGMLCLMAMGFVAAAQGQRKDIPVVGPFSRREIGFRDAWKQIIDAILRLVRAVTSFRKQTPSTPSSALSTSPPSPPSSVPTPPIPHS